MNKTFIRLSDHLKIDLISYIKEILSKRQGLVYVASDSQNTKRHTTYTTVVVIHYASKFWNPDKNRYDVVGGKGAHVVYCREQLPKIREVNYRLFKETEFSMEVANYLASNNIPVENIHLDYNTNPRFKSNEILKSALGWVESSGLKASAKPETSFTYMANKICKSKPQKNSI